jgi:hypothetical protein
MALDLENYLEITPGTAKKQRVRLSETALDGTPAQERMLLVRWKTAPNRILPAALDFHASRRAQAPSKPNTKPSKENGRQPSRPRCAL